VLTPLSHYPTLRQLGFHAWEQPTFSAARDGEVPAMVAEYNCYRSKGIAYLGDLEFVNKNVRGGLARVLGDIEHPEIRTFLQQDFRASGWYPTLPSMWLHNHAARLRGLSLENHFRQVGRWHADTSFDGLYRALLRVLSEESVALWVPKIASLYHNFGSVRTRVASKGHVTGERVQVPAELVPITIYTSAAFLERAMEITGAHHVRAVFHGVEPEPMISRVPTCRVHFEVRWVLGEQSFT
jgi:hypothetical protein